MIQRDELAPVVAVPTRGYAEGLDLLIHSLLPQMRDPPLELIIVADEGLSADMRVWLERMKSTCTVLTVPTGVGPGGARNAAIAARPLAEAYLFFDDDVILRGGEVAGLLSTLRSSPRIAVVSGIPLTEDGRPMATSYSRRPLSRAFAALWDSWWQTVADPPSDGLLWVDAAPASAIAVRGDIARTIRGFDLAFWPACFEDLDFCARVRFLGKGVVVDPQILVPQKVSATMRKVFANRYPILCRSSGVLYAVTDYPVPFAFARVFLAALGAVAGKSAADRLGDADGFLRCARMWREIIRSRRVRGHLRKGRRKLARVS